MYAAPSAVVTALLALDLLLRPLAAAERPVAVFEFELVDTSRGGEAHEPRPDEHRRLAMVSRDLRERLAKSDTISVVDIAPVDARARAANLQACGGCDAVLAAEIGAALSITGIVHKVSNLILNMRIHVRDVTSGRVIAAVNADMRGDTDESWSRALAWLVRNRLQPILDGVPQ